MKTTFNLIKDRENVNFNGTVKFSLDELKNAIKTAKKAVTKKEDLLSGKLILQVSKLHAAVFSDAWGIMTAVYFPIISTDAEFTAILSPEFIAKIEAEKRKKIEAVLTCCACQIVLSYSENSFEFENPRCEHYGPHFIYSGDASFSLDADDLKTAIKRTEPVTSKDGGRYALTGIYIDADAENEVNFISTDGCRMSVQRIETAVNIQDRALIDKNTALKLSRIFDGYKGNIEFNADYQFAYFSGRGITVICSQLTGKFPDWKSGMGQIKNFNRFEIAASEFCKIEPLKNGITHAEPGIVFHKIERLGAIAAASPAEPENTVLIGADAPDFPNMKLNYNYVTDFIKNLSSEESFLIQYKTGSDGVLFTAGNWNYLLMPMNAIYIPEEHTRRIEYLKKEVKTARADETRAKNKHFKKGDLKTSDIYIASTKRRERAEKELEATEKMFESSREKWGKFFENIENIAWKKNGIGTTQEKPIEPLETAAAADAVQNTTPTAEAPEKQAEKEETTEKPEQEIEPAKEETQRPSLPPCRAFVFSSKDVSSRPGEVLATVKKALASDYKNEQPSKEEKQAAEQPSKERNTLEDDPVFQAMKRAMEAAKTTEPAERPSVRASEPAPVESAPLATALEPENRSAAADQNGNTAAEQVKTDAEPVKTPTAAAAESEPVETAAADAEKPFEIGTYTTKKGKIKTSIKFFQPPTPAQIEALKKAYFWEYAGTWNGSPRKLPEIFKH